jgi:hypothetical protein
MQSPTYLEFRQLALSQGWTSKDLAPFVQADQPEKTAERILYHLAGVVSTRSGFRWDDCPLPYPILCEVYTRGALDRSLIEMPLEPPAEPDPLYTRTCSWCAHPLTGREDARFCSDLCRQRAHRRLKGHVSHSAQKLQERSR